MGLSWLAEHCGGSNAHMSCCSAAFARTEQPAHQWSSASVNLHRQLQLLPAGHATPHEQHYSVQPSRQPGKGWLHAICQLGHYDSSKQHTPSQQASGCSSRCPAEAEPPLLAHAHLDMTANSSGRRSPPQAARAAISSALAAEPLRRSPWDLWGRQARARRRAKGAPMTGLAASTSTRRRIRSAAQGESQDPGARMLLACSVCGCSGWG